MGFKVQDNNSLVHSEIGFTSPTIIQKKMVAKETFEIHLGQQE